MPKPGYYRDMNRSHHYDWNGRPSHNPLAEYFGENRYYGCYKLLHGTYHRRPQTTNERRQNYAAQADGLRVRRRRLGPLPHAWDDLNRSRNFGRSWKDYTKRRKQWEDR